MSSLKNFFKKVKWESLLVSIVAIAFGIVFVALPESSGNGVCYALGAIFICLGSFLLVRHFIVDWLFFSNLFVLGALMITAGILCFAKPELTKSILTVIFGGYLIIDGFSQLQDGVNCVNQKVKGAWWLFILAIISILFGCIVAFGTFDYIMMVCGISLIIEGICNIITTLKFSTYIKKTEKNIKNSIKTIYTDAIEVDDESEK